METVFPVVDRRLQSQSQTRAAVAFVQDLVRRKRAEVADAAAYLLEHGVAYETAARVLKEARCPTNINTNPPACAAPK